MQFSQRRLEPGPDPCYSLPTEWLLQAQLCAGPGETVSERLQHGGVMRRRRGFLPVQRVHPESGGQTVSDQPHTHQDKTGASGLASFGTNHEHLSLLSKKKKNVSRQTEDLICQKKFASTLWTQRGLKS